MFTREQFIGISIIFFILLLKKIAVLLTGVDFPLFSLILPSLTAEGVSVTSISVSGILGMASLVLAFVTKK